MQKCFFFFFIAVLFSCKKDFSFNEEALIDNPFVPHFYAEGSFVDSRNNASIDFALIDTIDLGFTTLYSGSVSNVGENNGYKYIVSVVMYNAEIFRSYTADTGSGSNYYLDWLQNLITVKITSNIPLLPGTAYTRFSREELLELLQVGRKYEFGNAPFQVEVGFQKPSLDSLPVYSGLGYVGSTLGVENENSVFEILEIEEYQETEVNNGDRGFKVKVKISADIRYYSLPVLSLKDVEAVFLFEYE